MKKIIIIMSILGLLIPAFAYSYQFEDYVWGKPKDEIYQQIIQKGKKITSNANTDSNQEIEYSDIIFDEPCQVGVVFTPKTKLLCGIVLRWGNTSIGEKLQKLLTEKYGEPRQLNKSSGKLWGNEDDGILLNYVFMKTEISYFNVYFKMLKKEESEVALKEGYRF